jgi:hypothetical protein
VIAYSSWFGVGRGVLDLAVDTDGIVIYGYRTISRPLKFRSRPAREDVAWRHRDGFVTKFKRAGSAIVFSTLIGGTTTTTSRPTWRPALDAVQRLRDRHDAVNDFRRPGAFDTTRRRDRGETTGSTPSSADGRLLWHVPGNWIDVRGTRHRWRRERHIVGSRFAGGKSRQEASPSPERLPALQRGRTIF